MIELVVLALAAGGVAFALVSVTGLIRLPDVYSRVHAGGKADTLAAALALSAAAIAVGFDLAIVKILFLGLFLFATAPTAAHAISRAALDQDIHPWTLDDEDADADEEGNP